VLDIVVANAVPEELRDFIFAGAEDDAVDEAGNLLVQRAEVAGPRLGDAVAASLLRHPLDLVHLVLVEAESYDVPPFLQLGDVLVPPGKLEDLDLRYVLLDETQAGAYAARYAQLGKAARGPAQEVQIIAGGASELGS
jgi:hypothetical protein